MLTIVVLPGADVGEVCERAPRDWLVAELGSNPGSTVYQGIPARAPAAGTVAVLAATTPLLTGALLRRAAARARRRVVLVDGRRGPALLALPARRWPRLAPLLTATALPTAGALTGARLSPVRLRSVDPTAVLDVTDPYQRAQVTATLYRRIARGWLDRGVRVEDPFGTRIGPWVRLAPGCVIRPGSALSGATDVGAGTVIGPDTTVRDCVIGADSALEHTVAYDARVGDGARVGPYSWLRSGARIGDRSRIGVFVEIAASSVGTGSAVAHLSVLSGADVGDHCNIGGLTGFANYDGTAKYRTTVESRAWIGGGNILCAPVTVGAGAYTAAGSIITDDVPPGALGIARARQCVVPGWVARHEHRSTAAHEAHEAQAREAREPDEAREAREADEASEAGEAHEAGEA